MASPLLVDEQRQRRSRVEAAEPVAARSRTVRRAAICASRSSGPGAKTDPVRGIEPDRAAAQAPVLFVEAVRDVEPGAAREDAHRAAGVADPEPDRPLLAEDVAAVAVARLA